MNKKYFISFIEEFWSGQKVKHLGRVEVYDDYSEYAIDEIRFAFNDTELYSKIREKWDFKKVTEKELKELENILKTEIDKINKEG